MTHAALAAAFTLFAFGARAEPPPGEPHHQPPKEAYNACASSKAQDKCAVTLDDRTIDGTCAADADAVLFCRPAHPPGGHHRGPPPEAFTACEGKAAAAACTVQHHDQSVNGTCEQGPDGGDKLACRPERPPEGKR